MLQVVLLFCGWFSVAAGQQLYRFDGEDIRTVLQMHNEARKAVGAPAMKKMIWSSSLADKAAEVVLQCRFRHSVPSIDATKFGFDHLGENVFAISGAKPTAQMIIKSFLKEGANFDLNTGRCFPGKRCGHYTQVVWSSTELVGCAMAACDDIPGTSWSSNRRWIIAPNGYKGGYVATCLYGPGGNYLGEKPFINASGSSGRCSTCSFYNKKAIWYGCDGDGLCARLP